MRYHVLATDYDGTLARHGHVDEPTVDCLKELRDSGRRLVLVTGRRLEPLLDIFPHISLFEQIVAENGALLYDPATGEEEVLGEPTPPEYAEELRRRGVDRLETGRSIVATWQPYETVALEVIREMALDLQIIFNKDAVMILPSGMNKAAGLQAALKRLKLSPLNAVAVGDAENDEAMMRVCGVSAAVANSLQPVKEMATIVLDQPRGAGVQQLVSMILDNDLDHLRSLPERGLPLGTRLDGTPFTIPAYGDSVLVTGGPGGGKSKLASSVLERLATRGEQCCIIDPEGDYQSIQNSITLGNAEQAPTIQEIVGVLKEPGEHCIVSFFSIDKADRPSYFDQLHRAIAQLRSRTGRPHWVVVDEAHYAAPKGWQPAEMWSGDELAGMIFITAYHDHISQAVLKNVDWIISIAEEPHEAITQCCQLMGEELPEFQPPEDNKAHRALAWRRGDKRPMWFSRFAPRSDGRRHRHSYYEGEMEPSLQFVFRGPDDELALSTGNLKEFIKTAGGVGNAIWSYHLHRHDYSTWFRDVIQDTELAARIDDIERRQDLSPERSRELILSQIHDRFHPAW